jgi:glucosamine-6-phosphate deaminase
MELLIYPTKEAAAQAAADKAAEILKAAIARKGQATFVAATGASQFEFLAALTAIPGIDWGKTTMFHMDEYIGLPEGHPASFHRYLYARLIDIVHPGTVHLVQGNTGDPQAECDRINKLIAQHEIDVTFAGIGENGHLAFNDPPADFDTTDPFIVVNLDEACRRQQLGEGWFKSFDEIPAQAISISIQQIMKSKAVICTVPDRRKAQAVHDCFTGEITPDHPSSILRQHEHAYIYLDAQSASLLPQAPVAQASA